MKLLTRREAAAYLRLSLRKLDGLAARGEIPKVKFGHGQRARVLYRQDDLDTFVNRHVAGEAQDIRDTVRRLLGGDR